ncbi:hypothetical protein NUITMVA2_09340 [Aeromonas caviae]|uniref:phage head spike fiber domain-containing protein n=1 Tax=Aeromonas caviae TaxID=648 RepID=UPI001F18D11F|nr:hypothetical protein [Aeromonas caviae]BDC85577.1 hypothetical protein NUITMVA2_09340 [Aeromonas caviae]
MAGLWQRTGNVTVTNGSKTVTGFGTKWKTGTLPIQKGHTFYGPDNAAYEIDTVVSDTEILLVDTYRGGTLANQPYRIDITRTSTISQFAADLASLVGKYRTWFDGMMTWLTGSGDVSILNPDTGANTTIPSWKKVASEGEGQTARAKVEADRAKTEADRALTEADRAAGIVATAALPLPDVLAPLSDSLRMITGYGREVKVGDDVVARMVNFSRSTTRTYTAKDGTLKIAAINEPCFEKDGLHLDVQSTNLWPSQTAVDSLNAAPASTSLPDGTTGNIYKITPTLGAFAYVRKNFAAQSGNHTLSCYAKLDDGSMAMPSLYCGSNGSYSTKLTGVHVGNGWWRMQAALLDPLGNIGFGYHSAATETTPVWVCNFQLEALPFASSYIPTNGAAVTRAADLLQVVGPGNHPHIRSGVPFTLAMRMSCEEASSGSMRDMLLCQSVAYGLLRRSNNTIRYYRDGSGQLSLIAPAKTVNIVAVRVSAGNVCTLRVGSNQTSRTEVPLTGGAVSTIDIRNVAGHVRDFRIWQHSLTDEQFKAIA